MGDENVKGYKGGDEEELEMEKMTKVPDTSTNKETD